MNLRSIIGHLLAAALLCLSAQGQAATEVGGVSFADKAGLGASELHLNGAGLRSKLFLRVYAIGLYLATPQADAAAALADPGPKRLRIVTLRDLTTEQFADALVEGVRRNHTETELESLTPRVETFKAAILTSKSVDKGAVIHIDWLPEKGTHLEIDGQRKSADIPGDDFFRALLKIWIGPKPAQDDLKDALLGKSR